jgi:hypothetical protein
VQDELAHQDSYFYILYTMNRLYLIMD